MKAAGPRRLGPPARPRAPRLLPGAGEALFRASGGVLVLLTLLPLYRLLDRPETGLIGARVLESTSAHVRHLGMGTAVVVAAVALVLLAVPADRLRSGIDRAAALLERGPDRIFAMGLGLAAGVATLLLNQRVFEGRPNLIDGAAQLLHARYLAAGKLAGPAHPLAAEGFWYFPNTLLTAEGWVSHYPPGHALSLAPGLALGVPWLGPVVVAALTGSLTALLARTLLPDDPRVARSGALLGSLSPLLLLQGASYMNHSTAALLGVGTLLLALRGRTDHRGWTAATGAGIAALLAVRPLAALAICLTVVLLVWAPRPSAVLPGGKREGLRSLAVRSGVAVLGGLPFLVLHAMYNRRFFGHPLTFGYHRSFGEAAGLGFGIDPWGNVYRAREALGYLAADLAALNKSLLELPLPVVTLAGAALLLGLARSWAARLVAGWALLPVLLGVFYWHHGHFMGPRMIADVAPAWGLLLAMSLGFLLRKLPGGREEAAVEAPRPRGRAGPRAGPLTGLRGRLDPRLAGGASIVAALVWGALLLPDRLQRHGGSFAAPFRMAEPRAPEGSLVFVTGSWLSRINADLVSSGVQQAVAETAIRQNPTCRVQEHRRAFRQGTGAFAGEAGAASLDLERRPPPYGLERGEVGQGTAVAFLPGERLAPSCVAEIRADERGGQVEAGYLLWLGDLPGIERGRPMYVRDMGPEANARLMARFPGREPYVLMRSARSAAPELLPYEAAARMIWGEPGEP